VSYATDWREQKTMMFEGEITNELSMLIYIFIALITIYVIITVVFSIWHKKGKAYEIRKQKEQHQKQNQSLITINE
jgi:hypothetical protein